MATKQNIAIIPANNGLLQCSLDGGQTWTGNQPIPYMQTTVINGPFTAGSTTIDLASTRGYSNGVQFTLYLDDGSPIYLTQSGAPSGSTITFTPAFPPGTSASAGNALYSNNIGADTASPLTAIFSNWRRITSRQTPSTPLTSTAGFIAGQIAMHYL